ncbi:MAG: alpha/beta fold hydrolase [Deltaproteobacteria bacterium]|nr:alpha/beta fold hydrolase [Deltaproteobacteria bacterium]
MAVTRVFIHGLESSGRGTKGTYFGKRYPSMIIEDYTGPLDARMNTLREILAGREDLIIVGSSYGGLMAAIYACENPHKVKKLILLAPALDIEEFEPYLERRLDMPVIVYHGSGDDVVPVEPVRAIASKIFSNLVYTIIDDDHPLSNRFASLDWPTLLESEEGS